MTLKAYEVSITVRVMAVSQDDAACLASEYAADAQETIGHCHPRVSAGYVVSEPAEETEDLRSEVG